MPIFPLDTAADLCADRVPGGAPLVRRWCIGYRVRRGARCLWLRSPPRHQCERSGQRARARADSAASGCPCGGCALVHPGVGGRRVDGPGRLTPCRPGGDGDAAKGLVRRRRVADSCVFRTAAYRIPGGIPDACPRERPGPPRPTIGIWGLEPRMAVSTVRRSVLPRRDTTGGADGRGDGVGQLPSYRVERRRLRLFISSEEMPSAEAIGLFGRGGQLSKPIAPPGRADIGGYPARSR